MITLIAWAMFGQRLDVFALCGIALIVAGVLVIRVLSDASAY
jgi:multidrug transporter EmrE-like cation transporter